MRYIMQQINVMSEEEIRRLEKGRKPLAGGIPARWISAASCTAPGLQKEARPCNRFAGGGSGYFQGRTP